MATAAKTDAKTDLIAALNEDLANELQAIIMYIQYSALANGPYRPQLVTFFQAEIPDEQGHAQYLADKIVALGGTPTTTPTPVPAASGNRAMLEQILKAEETAIKGYTERVDQAEQAGEIGLRVQLENFITDETRHYEEVKKMLTSWNG
jgi:bacterioferritin